MQPTPRPNLTRRQGRRLLIGLAAAAIVLSGLRLGLVLKFMREQAIESNKRLTESFAHIIAEQTTRTFQTVDQRLLLAATRLKERKSAGTLTEESARALLREEIEDLPFVRALWVLDASGRTVHDSDEGNTGKDFADRDYFQAFKTRPETSFYIGVPIRSRTHGTWMITAARPLRSASGAFQGVLVGAVDPLYFDRLWQEVDLGSGGSITLFRRDGVLMMRSPFADSAMGQVFERLPAFTALHGGPPVGTFTAVSSFDRVLRIFAYRTSPASELVVLVGKSHDLVLAPWREFAAFALTAWVGASAGIIILGAVLNRIWLARLRTEAQAEQMAERLSLATEAAGVGVWDWELETGQWFNTPTYFTMLGYSPVEGPANRHEWLDRLHPDDRTSVEASIGAAIARGDAPYHYEARMRHADGSYRWIRVAGRVLSHFVNGGKITRLLGVRIDVTEGKEAESRMRDSLREKEALLNEVHHRVKNNLQVITSLLRLEQSRTAAPSTRSVLTDMQGRIRSMALLHETLYRTGVFAEVDLASYLRGVASHLFRSLNEQPARIQLVLDLSSVKVGMDQAIPCGLIVNELVTNSLKHGFTSGQGGDVRVMLRRESDGRVRLEVGDTGVGIGADFETKRGNSLGLQLVADLARQLRGQLEVGSGPATRFTVMFQADRPNEGLAPLAMDSAGASAATPKPS
ncbi:MAG: PAS domain-containing protein [Vicinamibacteria bacterium]|nr:PAS domain-containing protein [Vicinamibacteria bacterium]